jgi:hypothetical protein
MMAFLRRLAILPRSMLIGWLAFLIHPPLLLAAEPETVSSARTPSSAKDSQFTLYARQAIMQDEELSRFNLGVTVRSGVATLWGTLPNAAIARRATERVRQVPGLIEVRSEIRIIAAEDETPSFSSQVRLEQRGTTIEDRASKPASKTTTASYRNTPSPAVMPSIPVPARERAHVVVPMKQPDTVNESLPEMVLHIRQGDIRYRLIQFEIRDGTIRLWSAANQQENLFAMAQAVARLPGVKGVIVENELRGLHGGFTSISGR